ncbi:MAG: DUF4190 domain-containing protein [Pseudoclavibacter sp.]|nr:DUF4190 domain-containing protein [Pseudoclavibacter sp.]
MTQPAPYSSGPVAPGGGGKTNVLSIVALVTGILGLGIVPVICGHISLKQIRATGEDGKVMAIIGLVLGYITLVVGVLLVIMTIVGAGVVASQSGY